MPRATSKAALVRCSASLDAVMAANRDRAHGTHREPFCLDPEAAVKAGPEIFHAIAAVSSTICCGLNCSRRLLNSSFGTSAGVRVSAAA